MHDKKEVLIFVSPLYCGFNLQTFYKMDAITKGDKKYYSLTKFCEIYQIAEKTAYNWAKEKRADRVKIFNKSFFRLKDI